MHPLPELGFGSICYKPVVTGTCALLTLGGTGIGKAPVL